MIHTKRKVSQQRDGQIQLNYGTQSLNGVALARIVSAMFRGFAAIVVLCLLEETAISEQPHIAVTGDSTVHVGGLNNPNEPLVGWGEVFSEFFQPGISISVTARSGYSSEIFFDDSLLNKNNTPWQDTLDLTPSPDYVFIQFGHNDQKINEGKGTHAVDNPSGAPGSIQGTNDLYRVNLRRMVDEVRADGGIPILVTSVARRERIPDGKGGLKFDNDRRRIPDKFGNSYSLLDYVNATLEVGRKKKRPRDRSEPTELGSLQKNAK